MKLVVLFAAASIGLVVYLNGSVADPSGWTLLLAGVTGGALLGGHPKQPIGIDDDFRV